MLSRTLTLRASAFSHQATGRNRRPKRELAVPDALLNFHAILLGVSAFWIRGTWATFCSVRIVPGAFSKGYALWWFRNYWGVICRAVRTSLSGQTDPAAASTSFTHKTRKYSCIDRRLKMSSLVFCFPNNVLHCPLCVRDEQRWHWSYDTEEG